MALTSIQRDRSQTLNLSELLFSPALVWELPPHTDSPVELFNCASRGVIVRVRADESPKVVSTATTSFVLTVPPQELADSSFWNVRARILSQFVTGHGARGISSAFFKDLLQREYRPIELDNFILEGIQIDLNSPHSLRITRAQLGHKGELTASQLDLCDVSIAGAHITASVQKGSWHNVKVTGRTTQILGSLGEIVCDDTCFFHDCYLGADISRVNFNLTVSKNLKGCLYNMRNAPECVRRSSREYPSSEFEERKRSMEALQFTPIAGAAARNPRDRHR